MSGATIFPTFTVPMNIMKITIAINRPWQISLRSKFCPLMQKMMKLRTGLQLELLDTKTDLFGNSKGEKDDIVKSIKMPEMTVASTMIMSLALKLLEGPEEKEGEDIFV